MNVYKLHFLSSKICFPLKIKYSHVHKTLHKLISSGMQARFQCVSYLGKYTPFLSFPWHKRNAGIRWTHDSFLRRLGLGCEPVEVGTTFRHWAPIWLLLSPFKEQLKERSRIRIFKLRLSLQIYFVSNFYIITYKNQFILFYFFFVQLLAFRNLAKWRLKTWNTLPF